MINSILHWWAKRRVIRECKVRPAGSYIYYRYEVISHLDCRERMIVRWGDQCANIAWRTWNDDTMEWVESNRVCRDDVVESTLDLLKQWFDSRRNVQSHQSEAAPANLVIFAFDQRTGWQCEICIDDTKCVPEYRPFRGDLIDLLERLKVVDRARGVAYDQLFE